MYEDLNSAFIQYLANCVERWACTNKKCKAFFKVDGNRTIESYLTHDHPADDEHSLMCQKVSNACKRKATDDVFERPSKVMRRVLTADALEVLTDADLVQIR